MSNYEFKKLTPFKWFVLQNFPFIDEDFDAITNYQLFCKLGEEINKVIESQNLVGEQVETLTNAFNELQAYVENYFANLDVQEEINNKLDEMAESGELENILLHYVNTTRIYNTTEEMILDVENLVNNQKVMTLGYHNINDNGGSYFVISNEVNNDILQISLGSGLYANLLNFKNIEQLGVEENDNITTLLTNLLGKVEKIYLNNNYIINSTITLSVDYKLSLIGKGNIIFTNTDSTIFINDGELNVENIKFTSNNNYFPSHVIFNRNKLKVDNCIFENLKTLSNVNQISVIYSTKDAEIYNCTFKNLICFGNGIIADNQGVLRAILTTSEEDYTSDILVENCKFYNINTVNALEEIILDDADAIAIQGLVTYNKVYINNCYFNKAGKRIIKIQANNVNIENIYIDNTNYTLTCHSVMQIEGKDINIENINGNVNKSGYGFFIFNSENVNINNFNIKGDYSQKDLATNASITNSNSSNINVTNGVLDGFSQALTIYGLVSKNLNYKNINFLNCKNHFINISTRTQSDSSPEDAVTIENVNIDNCYIYCIGNANNRTMLFGNTDVEKHTCKNINITNTVFNLASVIYRTGTIYFNKVETSLINCTFILNNYQELNNPYYFTINSKCNIFNSKFNFIESNNENVPEIRLNSGADVFIENSDISGKININDQNVKLISNYNNVTTISGGSASTLIKNDRL